MSLQIYQVLLKDKEVLQNPYNKPGLSSFFIAGQIKNIYRKTSCFACFSWGRNMKIDMVHHCRSSQKILLKLKTICKMTVSLRQPPVYLSVVLRFSSCSQFDVSCAIDTI